MFIILFCLYIKLVPLFLLNITKNVNIVLFYIIISSYFTICSSLLLALHLYTYDKCDLFVMIFIILISVKMILINKKMQILRQERFVSNVQLSIKNKIKRDNNNNIRANKLKI